MGLHTDSEGSRDYLAEFRASNVVMPVLSVVAVTAEEAEEAEEVEAAATAMTEEVVVEAYIVDDAPDEIARSVAMVAAAGAKPDSSARYSVAPIPLSKRTHHSPLLWTQRAGAPCTEGHRPAVSPVVSSVRL